MNKRGGKVFVDANILVYADAYQADDVFHWIHQLYDQVYIHKMVLDELLQSRVRQKVQSYLDSNQWHLFDPDDENHLCNELYEIYEVYVQQITAAFRKLDFKKQTTGRRLKGTNDLGEIHCLSAALLLNATIICSNDLDIQEVIDDNQLVILSLDEQKNIPLTQDTLTDFCFHVCRYRIASATKVRKLIKTFQKERLATLDLLLSENYNKP